MANRTLSTRLLALPAAIFLSFACAGASLAAPFCVVSASGTQCFYYDAPSCQQAAQSQRGACVVNQQETQPMQPPRGQVDRPVSGPPFCVVSASGSQCYYYDNQSCQQAAQSQRGACVVNPNR